jgi:hypothetical protein
VTSPIWVAEQKPPQKKERQEYKRVQIKQRHGAVEQAFRPDRKTSLRSPLEQHGPPMMKQQ